jgi:PAS domain S-box-containing protein
MNRRARLTFGAAILVMVLCLALATMDVIQVWSARDRDMREAERTTSNLLEAVGSQVQDTFDVAAVSLVGVANGVSAVDGDPQALASLNRLLTEEIASARPHLRSLVVIDPDGMLIANSAPFEPRQRHYDDRAYFQYHRDHPGTDLHIGPPVLSRSDNVWIITLSRRVDRPDGGLMAVIVATIETGYFQAYYDTFDIGQNGAILLATADATLLVRRPFDPANVGRDMTGSSLFRDFLPKAPSGIALTRSSTDGVVRLNNYRRLSRYPLVIAAALAEDDILADWWLESRGHLAGTTALLVFTLALGIWLILEFRDRLRTEARAAQTAADYRLLADNSTDLILRVALDGTCRYASPACRSLFGVSPEQMVGTNLIERRRTQRPELREAFRRLSEGEERATILTRSIRPGGRLLQLEANMQRALTVDGTHEIVAVVRDVTERQAVAEALQTARDEAVGANLAKSNFLATVSHEIRTPMNGILGFADILLRSGLPPEQARAATLIQDSGNSLLAILNDVLDLSKIEAGRLELEPAPVCLPALADGALSILRSQADAKGLYLRLDLAADLPDWIEADPTRLRQILLNLLSNALKFTDHGGVSLAIRREGERLRFSVADTGMGIAKDRQSLLFQQFSQLHRSSSRQYGGTGLGLAISKRLVEAMPAGEIGVESDDGQGATFWFAAALPTVPAPPPVATPVLAGPNGAAAHILVAEDLFINQAVIESILLDAGHTVRLANNGTEAVAAVARERFDLILMDMEMPELDGIGATRAIRRSGGPMRDVPIIAVTANALESEARRCRDAGMNDHLTKPIDRTALLAAIQRWAGTP